MNRTQLVAAGKVALLFVVGVVLQVLLVSHIRVLGVTADLFLILTVLIAMSRGSLDGAVFGFCAGLLADIAFYQPLGVHAFILVLTGYFVGMVVARFGISTPWAVLVLVGVSSFASQFAFGLFQFITGPRGSFFTLLAAQMFPRAVLDALVAVPVFILLVRLQVLPPLRPQPGVAKRAAE